MSIHEWIQKGSISDEMAKKQGLKELVRCKDCKYRETIYCPFYQKYKGSKYDYWFCGDGVKRCD